MYENLAPEPHPVGATILTVIAGVLGLLDGVADSVLGSFATSVGAASLGGALDLIAGLAFLFGFLLLVLAAGLYYRPEAHVGYGVAILVVSFVSLVGGGGFLIGTVLGAVGGILAILFDDAIDDVPISHLRPDRVLGPGTHCSSCGALLHPGEGECWSCQAPIPSRVAVDAPRPAGARPGATRAKAPSSGSRARPTGAALSARPFVGCSGCGQIQPSDRSQCERCGASLGGPAPGPAATLG
jgi:hypothetical protein